MPNDSLVAAARRLWGSLSGVQGTFTDGVTVVTAPESRICPPGYTGIVTIAAGALITAPSELLTSALRRHLNPDDVVALTDPATFAAGVPHISVGQVLGPARLAYTSPALFVPSVVDDEGAPEVLGVESPEVAALLAAAGGHDAEESGLAGVTSGVFVVRERSGTVVAASGYRTWPGQVAHLCVLTVPAARGRGAGRLAASRATARALDEGLLPQWRARVPASLRVASRLGFADIGAQLSIELCLDAAGVDRPQVVP